MNGTYKNTTESRTTKTVSSHRQKDTSSRLVPTCMHYSGHYDCYLDEGEPAYD